MENPLEIVSGIHRNLSEWLETVRKFPDPAAQPAGALENISQMLKIVDQAVGDAGPELTASQAWNDELASYAKTLTKVRARLANFEILLQIRRSQSASARTRIGAIHSWADLAKHIG